MRTIRHCVNHPGKPANKFCDVCKIGLCKWCGTLFMGKAYCEEHAPGFPKSYRFKKSPKWQTPQTINSYAMGLVIQNSLDKSRAI